MFYEQLSMQTMLPNDATRGAEEGQQMLPETWTAQVELQMKALAFR